MTVYYMVIRLIDISGSIRDEGIYKIKGRWYNIIDVLLSIASETKNHVVLGSSVKSM